MGAFEDAVKKKEAEIAADQKMRAIRMDEWGPSAEMLAELKALESSTPKPQKMRAIRMDEWKPSAEMLAQLKAGTPKPLSEYVDRVEALKEEERAKAMKKAASMKEK